MEGAEEEEEENRDFNQTESKLLQVHTHSKEHGICSHRFPLKVKE